MDYITTRDASRPVPAGQAFGGAGPADRLFVPERLPRRFRDGDMAALTWLTHGRRIAHITSMFWKEMSFDTLVDQAEKTYTKERFGVNSTPIAKWGGHRYLELWHGPSGSPADLSAAMLPVILGGGLAEEGGREPLFAVTGGQDALAVLEAAGFAGRGRVLGVCAKESLSPGLEGQLAASSGAAYSVDAAEGEIQEALAGLPVDCAGAGQWTRFLSQVVVYISAYCEMVLRRHVKFGLPVNIGVADNDQLAAAFFTKVLGVPINAVICAVEPGSLLSRLSETGGAEALPPSLERLLFELGGRDPERVKACLAADGSWQLDDTMRKALANEIRLVPTEGGHITEAARASVEEDRYPLSPKTAAARCAADRYAAQGEGDTPTLIVAEQNPYVYAQEALALLGEESAGHDAAVARLAELTDMEPPVRAPGAGKLPSISLHEICSVAKRELSL